MFIGKAGGICDDSRLVKDGDVFFIIPKKNFNIFSVLRSVDKKARLFVAPLTLKKQISKIHLKKEVIFVKDIQRQFRRAVDEFYGFKNKDFKFVGITGTKGKTTVAYFIYQFLKQANKKVSLLSTVKYHIGRKSYAAYNTTPGYLALRKLFCQMEKERQKIVVMEVSSHGIEQGRIDGVKFARCVFTNLSHEHLDYHKTMRNYFSVKSGFFLKNKNAVSLVNTDDKYGRVLFRKLKRKISFGIDSEADFCAKDIRFAKNGTQFNLCNKNRVFRVSSMLLGRHNVLNILAGIAVIRSLGFRLEDIVRFVPSFTGVSGRLQKVSEDIFVDYAHTHDSLKKTLQTLRQIGYGNIICVFGCGGERDRQKRPLMGKIASLFADFTFITSDNPRGENPVLICRAIEKGFLGDNYRIILNRKDAIKEGVKLLGKYPHSCLVVAGKGHECYQIVKDTRIPFRDQDVIRECLAVHS